MGIEFLVPLIAGTIYTTTMVITICNRPRTIQHKYFIVYLLAAILWSLSDSLLRSDLFIGQKLLLFRIVVVASTLWVIQLYCFSRSFLKMPLGIGAKVGYALSFLFLATVIAGFSPPSINFQGGYVKPTYGWWIILYIAPLVTMAVFGLFSLIKRLRMENNPDEYNKSFYLITAMGFLISFGFLGVTPLANHFPLSHIGGLISACILAYAVVQHELIAIKIVLRRLLGWLSVGIIGTTVYVLVLIGIHHVLAIELGGVTIFLATLFAAGLSGLVYWLRPIFMKKLDQLFYRKRYADRKELFDFVTHRIRGVYNLQELGRGLLPPLVNTINSLGAYLLLPDNSVMFPVVFVVFVFQFFVASFPVGMDSH